MTCMVKTEEVGEGVFQLEEKEIDQQTLVITSRSHKDKEKVEPLNLKIRRRTQSTMMTKSTKVKNRSLRCRNLMMK